jgi:hypothetical protein
MIYYPIGRATSVVGRLPGMAATSGRENRPVLWLRTLSLFHFMDTIKIMIMIVTFMNPCLMGQTIGIKNLDAVTMDPAQAQALTTRVQETATRYVETVTRNQGLLDVLNEHSLAMAGATTGPDDSLGLTRATQIISGSAGSSAPDRWFINLCMTDVASGRVLDCKYASTTCFKDLMTMTKTVTKALLQGTRIEDDPAVKAQPDSTPIIIGTQKYIQEIHVYEHKAGTHGNKRFVPCSYCQGRGKVPCHECPFGGEKDCPYCSATSRYSTTANGPGLTGHWE